MSNIDLNAAKRIIYMLSNFYPERMGQCLLVSAPMLFSAAWAVIRPWLSRRTQTKIEFCKPHELGRWMAPTALPRFWGGLDETVYSALYVLRPPPRLLACVASLLCLHVPAVLPRPISSRGCVTDVKAVQKLLGCVESCKGAWRAVRVRAESTCCPCRSASRLRMFGQGSRLGDQA